MALVIRSVVGILAGLAVAFVLLIAVEMLSAVVHPAPPEFKGTMEEMCEHVSRYPQWVLVLVVPLWAGTAYAGTWIAGRVGNTMSAWFVGLLLLVALVFNILKLPYPIWFKVVMLIVIPAALYLGSRRSKP